MWSTGLRLWRAPSCRSRPHMRLLLPLPFSWRYLSVLVHSSAAVPGLLWRLRSTPPWPAPTEPRARSSSAGSLRKQAPPSICSNDWERGGNFRHALPKLLHTYCRNNSSRMVWFHIKGIIYPSARHWYSAISISCFFILCSCSKNN